METKPATPYITTSCDAEFRANAEEGRKYRAEQEHRAENQQLAFTAAKRLYEKGLQASSVVGSLKKGGHALEDVAHAARQFSEMDAMLFGESWGGDEIHQHAARRAFLGWNK